MNSTQLILDTKYFLNIMMGDENRVMIVLNIMKGNEDRVVQLEENWTWGWKQGNLKHWKWGMKTFSHKFIVFFGQTISPHFPSFSCFSTKNFSDLTIIYSKYWSKRVWEIVIMQSVFALLKERCRSNGCYKLHVLLATKHLP